MKTKPTILVLAVLVLASLFAVRANRQAGQTRAAIAALVAQRAGLQAATATMDQRLRTATEALAQLERRTGQPLGEPDASGGADAAASGKAAAAKPATPARRLSAVSIITNDPQKTAEYAQNYRVYAGFFHGGMFKALGLSAEQTEKFKDLMVWQRQRQMDLDAAAEMQGLDRKSAAYKQLQAEHDKIVRTKEAELLGDLEPRYREYRRTYGVRGEVVCLVGNPYYSGEPMTLAQFERTTQILAANCQRGQEQEVRRETVNWEAARVQLRDVLSPTQIVTLGHIIQADVATAKAGALTKRLTAEFKAKQAAK